MSELPPASSERIFGDAVAPEQRADLLEHDDEAVTGDAATYLEALVVEAVAPLPPTAGSEGLPLELVGQHLRLSGTVIIGFHRRLSDFVNNHEGLIELRDVTVLRRNGDPTRVNSPSIWVNPEEVTLIGQVVDVEEREDAGRDFLQKKAFQLIVVTPGHTLTGEVHLNPDGVLSAFIESPSPMWIPMTDVRTRSLADRRVISRYGFALVNRRHIVAATELQPGMVRGRGVL
ncbi:MAG: hypothetical protein ACHQZR_07305 [Candidatus Limnocylindrales bacterium]